MRYLGSMLALLALTASVPAFASDYTPYHPSTERRVAAARHGEAAPPQAHGRRHTAPRRSARQARNPRRESGHARHRRAARVEPGGH